MRIKKAGKIVYGAEFTAAEQKAINMEIQRQTAEHDRKNINELMAQFLWYLHEKHGHGHDRLHDDYVGIVRGILDLCDRYEMTDDGDDIWLCTKKLSDYGIDLDKWRKEIQD
jgi:hypothetical protein